MQFNRENNDCGLAVFLKHVFNMLAASWPSFAGPWQNQNRGAHPKDFEEKEAAEKMLRKNPMDTIIGQDFQLYLGTEPRLRSARRQHHVAALCSTESYKTISTTSTEVSTVQARVTRRRSRLPFSRMRRQLPTASRTASQTSHCSRRNSSRRSL